MIISLVVVSVFLYILCSFVATLSLARWPVPATVAGVADDCDYDSGTQASTWPSSSAMIATTTALVAAINRSRLRRTGHHKARAGFDTNLIYFNVCIGPCQLMQRAPITCGFDLASLLPNCNLGPATVRRAASTWPFGRCYSESFNWPYGICS